MSRAGAWTKMKKGGHDDDKYDSDTTKGSE